jgi:hypothetical protein
MPTPPLWAGPESSTKNGGITQSLLGKFLACPARFKALVIDRLKPRDKFNHRIEYGNMFHLCEEVNSRDGTWREALQEYVSGLLIRYPYDQEDIHKWYRIIHIQYPLYLDYWSQYDTFRDAKCLLQEEMFCVPYKLPSGRTVYLRGKWDGVELSDGLWNVESKTKSEIDRSKIERRLKYDLQTMVYLVALREYGKVHYVGEANYPIKGVRYNVVKRPLSGGKGTIKQTKNETVDQYYDRLAQYIKDEPDTYFARWESEVSENDIREFEQNTLIPCLERLCWWYEGQVGNAVNRSTISMWQSLHYVAPFGVPHVTDEYGSDYDEYVLTGSTVGLVRCDNLFPELT